VDVVLNLLLLLPFGAGLGLAGWPLRRVAATAALLSFAIEALQYFVVTGRDASLGDVINNTIGGTLGAGLVSSAATLAAPSPARAGRLFAAGALAWLVVLALSAWLQGPGAQTRHLRSHWAHRAPDPYPFAGQVTSAMVDGIAMPPDGRPPDPSRVVKRLKRGEMGLALELISGPPKPANHWVYMLSSDGLAQLELTQSGRNAILRVPARATRYKLRPPSLSLPAGFPSDSGIPVTIEGGRQDETVRLKSTYAGERHAVELALSPAHGWALIAPFNFPLGPGVRLLTAAWIALWVMPLGYWATRTARPVRALVLLAGAVLLGLGAVPAFGGRGPVHWSEWLTAMLAGSAGWALGRFAAYLQLRCGSPSTSVSSSS
jgi:hypothetical protein